MPASAQTHMLCMPVKIYTDSGVNNKNGCPPHTNNSNTRVCAEKNDGPIIETADLLKEFITPAPQTKKICRVQLDLESLNVWCFLFSLYFSCSTARQRWTFFYGIVFVFVAVVHSTRCKETQRKTKMT